MDFDFVKTKLYKLAPDIANDQRFKELFIFLSVFIHEAYRESAPLQPSESICVALNSRCQKVAALSFDRVWAPFDLTIPDDIRYSGSSTAEVLVGCGAVSTVLKLSSGSISGEYPAISYEQLDKFATAMVESGLAKHYGWLPNPNYFSENIEKIIEAYLIKLYQAIIIKETNLFAVPFYEGIGEAENILFDPTPKSKEHRPSALICTLDKIDLVDPDSISWEQIAQFRSDEEARLKYNSCIRWFNKEMIGKGQVEIQDIIFERMDDYKWALKKNGIKTVLGTVSDVLSIDYLAGVSAVSGLGIMAGYPAIAAIAAGALTVGKLSVSVAEKWIDYKDIQRSIYRENRDIAFIHEIEQRFS